MRIKLVIALLSVLILTACGAGQGGSDGEAPTVDVGSVGGLTDAGLAIAQKRGYFEDAGLEVRFHRMDSAPALTNALATDQLDVAGISVSAGLYTAVTQGIELVLVGDKQSVRPGWSATHLVVQPELVRGSDAETIRNLRGKDIGISAKPSTVYFMLDELFEKHGMSVEDVHITELSYSNLQAALARGAVDAAVMLEPFLTQSIDKAGVKSVSDFTGIVPPGGATTVPIVYAQSFADDRAKAQKFMTAYMRGVRDYNDAMQNGTDKQQVVEIIARHAETDPAVVKRAYKWGLDPNQRITVEFLQDLQEFFVDQGYVRQKVDVRSMIDSSFAENAVKELGGGDERKQ